MASPQKPPAWLERHLSDTDSPPPKLYARTTANLADTSPSGSIHRNKKSNDNGKDGDGDLERRIFILGVGNIGRLFAACLARLPTRPPITLIVHREQLLRDWSSSRGIQLTPPGSPPDFVPPGVKNPFDVEWWTEEPPSHGPVREIVAPGRTIRNLIIATKAEAALSEVDRLRRYLGAESTVAFTQNGVCKLWPPHGETYLAHRYDASSQAAAPPSFLACVVSHGVYSLGPFRSVHAAAANVVVGSIPLTRTLASSGSRGYLTRCIAEAPGLHGHAVSSAELWLLQLEKLVYNTSINPLTAILRCKNGVLFQDHPDDDGGGSIIARVMDRLLDETSRVLQILVSHKSTSAILNSSSCTVQSNPSNVPQQQQQQQQQQDLLVARFAQPRLREALHAFGAKVAANTSSMLQDVQAGKTTEIRDFNGWLVETAAFLDPTLDMSTHRAVIEMVESGLVLTKEELDRRLLG